MKAKFRTERTFEDTQNFSKEPRAEDIVDVLKLPANDWLSTRAVGPVVAVGGHWVNVEPPKKDKKSKAFWVPCLAFDPKTEERDSTKSCPWCSDTSGWVRSALDYWQNFIVRSLEDDAPAKQKEHTKKERKTGFKEKSSKSWTPCKALRVAPGFMRDLKKAASLNRHKTKDGQKKAFPLSHVKCGVDLEIMYAPDEAPAKKYSLHKGEKRTPLSDEQQEYLLQDIEKLSKVIALTAKAEADVGADASDEDKAEAVDKALKAELKKQSKEYQDWLKRQQKKWKDEFGGSGEKSDDEDDDEDKPKGKGKKGKKSAGKKSRDEDEDDESSDDDDDDNEFKSDKKKSKKSKKRASDDDDDDDDEDEDSDEDDDDDEDDDPPPKKSKKSKKGKKSKKSKKSRDDDDDDEDEDDDDDEDEDDDD